MKTIDKTIAAFNARNKLGNNNNQKTYNNNFDVFIDDKDPRCPFPPIQNGREHITNCPDEPIYVGLWMLIRDATRPEHRDRPLTFVDVGCNKGYTIAALLETLNLTAPLPSSDPKDPAYVEPRFGFDPNATLTNNDVPGFFSREAIGLDIFTYAEKQGALSPPFRHNLCGGCCDLAEKNPYSPASPFAKHPWLVPKNDHVDDSSTTVVGMRRGNAFVPEVAV